MWAQCPGSHVCSEISNAFPDPCGDLGTSRAPGRDGVTLRVWLSALQWQAESAGVSTSVTAPEDGGQGSRLPAASHRAPPFGILTTGLSSASPHFSAYSCTFSNVDWICGGLQHRVRGTYQTGQISVALQELTDTDSMMTECEEDVCVCRQLWELLGHICPWWCWNIYEHRGVKRLLCVIDWSAGVISK